MRHAMLVLAACGGGGLREPSPAPSPAPPPLVVPARGAFTLPPELVRCTADEDCTFVALGCCDTTAVLRTRAAEVRAALEASGRPDCPVKRSCGPGRDGTWQNTPGRCVNGRCGGAPE